MTTKPTDQTKHHYMSKARAQAQKALAINEVPIGAIVVNAQGIIIGRGYNTIEKKQTQCAHAEVIALQKAAKKLGDWRLQGCWLYVTLEPCLMCLGLIQLSRCEGVVYGATSTLFGASLQWSEKMPSYAKQLHIEGGVQETECLALLKTFFGTLRKKGKRDGKGKSKLSR